MSTPPAPPVPASMAAWLEKPGRAVICNRDERGRYHWTMVKLGALEAVEDVRTLAGELVAVYRSKAK